MFSSDNIVYNLLYFSNDYITHSLNDIVYTFSCSIETHLFLHKEFKNLQA